MAMFSGSKKEELSLLIDIQSGLVRGALICFKADATPHVLFAATRLITKKEQTNSEELTSMMYATVEEIIHVMSLEGIERAKSLGFTRNSLKTVHYVLSSPWVISESKTIQINFDSPSTITQKLIHSLVDKEKTSLKDTLQKSVGNIADLVCIEQKIFEIKLNGYHVENYHGRKSQALEISFASTLGSNVVMEKIHSCVYSILHIKKHTFHSSLLLYFTSLRMIVGNREEFISIHVHSELTDIVMVKKGTCAYLSSFPFGTSTLTRKISETMKSSLAEADSILTLLFGDKLEEYEQNRVRKLIEPTLTAWHDECMRSINSLGEKTLIPEILYLSSHDNFEVFKNILAYKNGYHFEILTFDDSRMSELVTFEKTTEHNSLVSAYALALKDMI